MKARILALVTLVAGGLIVLGLVRVSAEFEASVGISVQSTDDFYQPLATLGSWVDVPSYGRCWHPAVTAEWRPYCDGRWEWTDCGWYWESDEPWAWACYHYGSWFRDPNYGWIWVPGLQWAPAWVTWRTGGDYIGWAPYEPPGLTVEPAVYVFVDNRHFGDHFRRDNVIVNDPTVIDRTRPVREGLAREERDIDGRRQTVFVNQGPDVARVEKTTGHKFTPVPVQKASEATYRAAPPAVRQRLSDSNGGRSTQPRLNENVNPPGTGQPRLNENVRPAGAGQPRLDENVRPAGSGQPRLNENVNPAGAGQPRLNERSGARGNGDLPGDQGLPPGYRPGADTRDRNGFQTPNRGGELLHPGPPGQEFSPGPGSPSDHRMPPPPDRTLPSHLPPDRALPPHPNEVPGDRSGQRPRDVSPPSPPPHAPPGNGQGGDDKRPDQPHQQGGQ